MSDINIDNFFSLHGKVALVTGGESIYVPNVRIGQG